MGYLSRAREKALMTRGVTVSFRPNVFSTTGRNSARNSINLDTSISSPTFMCGTLREASMLLTIARANPRIGTSTFSLGGRVGSVMIGVAAAPTAPAGDAAGAPPLAAASTSSLVMRPPLPEPATLARSTPSSLASRLTAGAASPPFLPAPAAGAAALGASLGGAFGASATGSGASSSPSPSTSMSMSGAPILMTSPSLLYIFLIRPL
mmetsp:Transcript_50052/g.125559  ORF Transcript_50052/g.125559 Transcript_50052/m.125559 type:complete len:208 (+) Transcript_50052:721-1344(+)